MQRQAVELRPDESHIDAILTVANDLIGHDEPFRKPLLVLVANNVKRERKGVLYVL